MTTTRTATFDELKRQVNLAARYRTGKVRYRHFIKERSMRTAKNGVQHIEYSQNKFKIEDDKVLIFHNNQWEPLTATTFINEHGKTITTGDIRLEGLK